MGSGGSLPGHTLGADPEAELDPFCALGPALAEGSGHQQFGVRKLICKLTRSVKIILETESCARHAF